MAVDPRLEIRESGEAFTVSWRWGKLADARDTWIYVFLAFFTVGAWLMGRQWSRLVDYVAPILVSIAFLVAAYVVITNRWGRTTLRLVQRPEGGLDDAYRSAGSRAMWLVVDHGRLPSARRKHRVDVSSIRWFMTDMRDRANRSTAIPFEGGPNPPDETYDCVVLRHNGPSVVLVADLDKPLCDSLGELLAARLGLRSPY